MTYKVGIIGCGRIAGGFDDWPDTEKPCTHAGTYKLLPETQLVAVADVSKEKAETFAKRWDVPRYYTDFKEMLKKEELDIVSVCTPDEYHAEAVIAAAKSGKVKAIFCEKIMATKLEDARAMVKACKDNNVKLIVDYSRRFNPVYQQIKKMVDDSTIGELLFIRGSYISGLKVMGTHVVDMLLYLGGEVESVYGEREEKVVETMEHSENYTPKDRPFSGILRFKNGALGFIDGTSRKAYEFFEIDVVGTKGRIFMSDTNVIYKEGSNIGFYLHEKGKANLVRKEFPSVKKENIMINAIKEVISVLKENRESIAPGTDGLKNVEMMLALQKSYEKGGKVDLPLKLK